jgi:calcium channel MID1
MQLPKLTPLQSRLLASVIATCLVITIWISFQPHHFVYAAELPVAPQDAEYSQLGQLIPPDTDSEVVLGAENHGHPEDEQEGGYFGDFAYFDRSLIGRAEEGVDTLMNNEAKEMDVTPGTMQHFILEKSQIQSRRMAIQDSSLELRDTVNTSENTEGGEDGVHERNLLQSRQRSSQVYITVNTCQQPIPEHIATEDPPQLTLYVSTSADNQKPGPRSKNDAASIAFQHGYAAHNATTASDVYIGIDAPALTKGWNGSFSFQITASTEAPYDTYDQRDTFLRMVDTDGDSSLFVTQDLVSKPNDTANIDKWMKANSATFSMYAFKETEWGGKGLEWSKCGLQWSQEIAANSTNSTQKIIVDATMTNRSTSLPKGQFHVEGLEKNTSYVGFLAMDGVEDLVPENMTTIRGSRVWNQFRWTTKAGMPPQSSRGIHNLLKVFRFHVPSNLRSALLQRHCLRGPVVS